MSNGVAAATTNSRRIGRSILALVAGFLVNVALSLVTDLALQTAQVLPAIGHGTMNNTQCAVAAAYRTAYTILSSYVVARLAPYRPMAHALIGAGIGMLLATAGAIATWNRDLGPHWYSVSLILLALPSAWVGAKLWIARAL